MGRSGIAAWSAAMTIAAGGCGSSTDYGTGGSPAASCTAATATAPTGPVALAGFAFVPSCAKVAAGTTVTFRNDDAAIHTVTSDAGQADAFDSGSLGQGAQFAHTFATAGTEHAHCTVHPAMRFTIFVQ